MACYKKTKNGDVVTWPCGKKEDGHVFEGNFQARRARNYEESPADKKVRKQNKKDYKEKQKWEKKRQKTLELEEKNPDKAAKKKQKAKKKIKRKNIAL